MKLRTAFLYMLVCVAPAPALAQDWGPGSAVRIATEGAYKPWNFREQDGKLAGFEIDLVKLLCADLKFRCSIQPERWGAMLPHLEESRFDAVFAGMSITPARRTKAAFTVAYATSPAVFVAAPGGRLPESETSHMTLPDLSSPEQSTLVALRRAFLNGTVGVQQGTTHESFLRDYIEGYAQVKAYENQGKLDAEANSGRLSAMLVSLGYAMPLLRDSKSRNLNLKIVGPKISGGPFGEGIGAAVRKSDEGLAALFSEVIRKRIADGSIARLSVQWFGFDLSAQP